MTKPYDPRTLRALIRHITEHGGSTQSYLRTHPRVSPEQIDAIFADLRHAFDRRGAEELASRQAKGSAKASAND